VSPDRLAAVAALALGAALGGLALALIPRALVAPPEGGEAGLQRRRARRNHRWFGAFEAVLGAVATHFLGLPLSGLRVRLAARIELAGHPLGLGQDELLAATALGATAGAVLGGALAAAALGAAVPGALVGFLAGMAYPWLKLDEAALQRTRRIRRGLPQAIDLAALAMQAGLDLPGALAQVAGRLAEDQPLRIEVDHLLHRMALGHSRAEALAGLAQRVPAPEVRQFVAAVIQADRQGTPLAEVLGIQAGVMRIHRSQAAEQKAARAAILLMGPLMLIFACVFLVLLGPFAVKWARGELF
jgi:tight adherence protein C